MPRNLYGCVSRCITLQYIYTIQHFTVYYMTWLILCIAPCRRRILYYYYYYYCTPPLPRSGFQPETLRPGVYGINPFLCAPVGEGVREGLMKEKKKTGTGGGVLRAPVRLTGGVSPARGFRVHIYTYTCAPYTPRAI